MNLPRSPGVPLRKSKDRSSNSRIPHPGWPQTGISPHVIIVKTHMRFAQAHAEQDGRRVQSVQVPSAGLGVPGPHVVATWGARWTRLGGLRNTSQTGTLRASHEATINLPTINCISLPSPDRGSKGDLRQAEKPDIPSTLAEPPIPGLRADGLEWRECGECRFCVGRIRDHLESTGFLLRCRRDRGRKVIRSLR